MALYIQLAILWGVGFAFVYSNTPFYNHDYKAFNEAMDKFYLGVFKNGTQSSRQG